MYLEAVSLRPRIFCLRGRKMVQGIEYEGMPVGEL